MRAQGRDAVRTATNPAKRYSAKFNRSVNNDISGQVDRDNVE